MLDRSDPHKFARPSDQVDVRYFSSRACVEALRVSTGDCAVHGQYSMGLRASNPCTSI